MENFNKEKFEKEGLKIDKERVLTYSQLSCPFDCRYCFVEDMNPNQQKEISYLSQNQFNLLEKLPDEISLIMLGCDTEFFKNKENSLNIIERLSNFNKDISIITKMSLSKDFINELNLINKKLMEHHNLFAFSETLTCIDSAREWEPKAPLPKDRIETLKNVFNDGIKTLVALRPLLPTISNEELEEIIILTKDFCYGYYSGPLYLKNLNYPFIKDNRDEFEIEKIQPHWMLNGNEFYKVEKINQMNDLYVILKKYNKPLFEGAAEAIKYLKTV